LNGADSKAKQFYAAAREVLQLCLESTEPLIKLDSLYDVLRARLTIMTGAQPLKAIPTGEKAAMFMKALNEVGGNRTRLAREMGVSIHMVRYWTGDTSYKKRTKPTATAN